MGYFDVLNLSGAKCEKLSVKFMCCITDERNSYLSVKHFHPARCRENGTQAREKSCHGLVLELR